VEPAASQAIEALQEEKLARKDKLYQILRKAKGGTTVATPTPASQ
jgi:uncharacterized protein YdcH (DUF465 family)